MKKSELYAEVLKKLREQMPPIDTELDYGSPFQLLVAVVLSAQCTDERVNIVCVPLFEKYPDAAAMAEAEIINNKTAGSFPENGNITELLKKNKVL